MIVWLLMGCTVPVDVLPSTIAGAAGTATGIVMTTTDFSSGALAVLDLQTGEVQGDIAPTSGDPFVVVTGGRVVQINGFLNDTIRLYEPGVWQEPLGEYGVGQGANPHDALLIDGVLWVSLYGRSALELRAPETGEVLHIVELVDYADSDGLPEASSMVLLDGLVLVALQRFDREQEWLPLDGRVVAIDPNSREVVHEWTTGTSPQLSTSPQPGFVWVNTGSYDGSEPAFDGGVSRLSVVGGLEPPVWDEFERQERVNQWVEAPNGDVLVLVDRGGGDYGLYCGTPGSWTRGPDSDQWLSDALVDDRGRAFLAARTLLGGGELWAIDHANCTDAGRAETTLAPYRLGLF
ncbi:MAG: hypothetical protein ACJAZO_001394 [Myxococcota bacterium]|jgi:hypothetical protein